ncbi:MAG: 5-formyltetrahydrofolate cyclo-ligase [Burkholderiales bacterium]
MSGAGARSADARRSAKEALRHRILAARGAIGRPQHTAACAAMTGSLIELAPYRRARTVSAYCSFGSEFDSAALLAEVLRTGKRLVLPRIDRAARRLVFHFVADLDARLVPGTWGILEPDPGRCPIVDLREIEFMLVPGVAFTRDCERLGYGGGFYDRVLAQLDPECRSVSAAFSLQIVDSLPAGPDDRRVDAVVTESGYFGLADQD